MASKKAPNICLGAFCIFSNGLICGYKLWHTFTMQFNFNTYQPGNSCVHQTDARAKLILLLTYSLTLFFVQSWMGLFICTALCLLLCGVARVSLSGMLKLLGPLYVILAFTLIFNTFSFDSVGQQLYGLGNVSAGLFADKSPVILVGSLSFMPAGFARGCFYVLRILLLMLASLLVTFTTTSNDLINALYDFLRPLKRFRFPAEDVATMISIAIRFIPLTAEELARVYAAQKARGAHFSEGNLLVRMKAWLPVLVPLFVGLFRRANALALAMESRCYGMGQERTQLHLRTFSRASLFILMTGVLLCVSLAVFL